MTVEELIAVLRGWQDFFPFPPTWTGELQRRAVERGPAPSRITCPACDGSGAPCRVCGGRGVIPDGDAYVGRVVKTGEASFSELLQTSVTCDGCGGDGYRGGRCATLCASDTCRALGYCRRLCDVCHGSGRVPAPLGGKVAAFRSDRERSGDVVLDAMRAQRKLRDDAPCYRAIVRAAGELPAGHRGVIVMTYVLEAQPPSSSTTRSVRLLHERLPAGLKPPRWLAFMSERQLEVLVRARGRGADAGQRGKRDAEIRRRRENGASIAELAAAFGLDKAQVSRITRAA